MYCTYAKRNKKFYYYYYYYLFKICSTKVSAAINLIKKTLPLSGQFCK